MGDSLNATLSHVGGRDATADGLATGPVLVLALECDRPNARAVRYRLDGLHAVGIGRGNERRGDVSADGHELTIKIPDRWLSTRHARLEHSFGRWILTDAESKNGTIVDGHTTRRTELTDGALIEVGHTMLMFFSQGGRAPTDPRVLDLATADDDVWQTLDAGLAQEYGRLRQVAGSDISILIEGQSGTGKEVLARALHGASGRHGGFVAVNCGALPDNLVESELFGYKRGAFSGATADQLGLVRAADEGTLFLDEIGDLPPAAQATLLRVLQEREVMPVGGTRPVPINLRVIAATHRDLDQMVADGTFRHDLLARLAGFRTELPSLRERRCDLGPLIARLHHRLFAAGHPGFDVEAARLLLRYPWPLNVRELEQALATASVLAGPAVVVATHLPGPVRTGRPVGAPRTTVLSDEDQALRQQVIDQLREHHGNVSAVARAMAKDRKQIQRWLKRFVLNTDDYK